MSKDDDIGGLVVPPQFVDELLKGKTIIHSHTIVFPVDGEPLRIENKEVTDGHAVMNWLANLSKAEQASIFARIKKELGISNAPMLFRIKGSDESTT